MDGERRHELEDNDLAESTVALVDRIRPHLRTIALALGGAMAALAAWTVVSSQQAASQSQSWDACMAALSEGNPERLTDVIRRYPGSAAGQWSQLMMADGAMAEGTQLLFVDRERARQRLDSAIGIYTGLLAERPRSLIAERAVFGLAKARESLGQLEEARRGYETIVAEYPESAVRSIAENRIAALSRESTRQWYDWFDGWKPAPAAPADKPAEPAAAGTGTGAGG
jgi:predicted negative regulator of RcsB-dependent stress response